MNWFDIFTYDEESPLGLIWAIKSSKVTDKGDHAGWKTTRKDGSPQNSQVSYKNKSYLIHRIIWELHNGPIPKGMVIDHIDGNPWNNKLCNLRLTDIKGNNRNTKKRVDNKTGTTGVCIANSSGILYVQAKIANEKVLFRIDEFGQELAFQKAIAWRQSKIKEFELKGEGFSKRHGT